MSGRAVCLFQDGPPDFGDQYLHISDTVLSPILLLLRRHYRYTLFRELLFLHATNRYLISTLADGVN